MSNTCRELKHNGKNIITFNLPFMNITHNCSLCEVCAKEIKEDLYIQDSLSRGYYSSMNNSIYIYNLAHICPCCGNLIFVEDLNKIILKFNKSN